MKMQQYQIIGIMSGTSLDGVDIALCEFDKTEKGWKFEIQIAKTYQYSQEWIDFLKNAGDNDILSLSEKHKEYGKYIGAIVNEFLRNRPEKIDFLASHGHTIFHQPEKGITYQLGDGATIASTTGITTISDFRSKDVALGGQGAPLVPIGDELLFPDYDYCINLGGFANISYVRDEKRVAFDICPVNTIINHVTQTFNNLEFDRDGNIAKAGVVNQPLLTKLNSQEFYQKSGPKSLGKEWLESDFLPIISNCDLIANDLLRTIYEHISSQIRNATKGNINKSILISGGGAHNKFLVECIKKQISHQIIIPDKIIIDFKEAMIFAFLGVLRFRNEINCLSSVTGARRDSVGGIIYYV